MSLRVERPGPDNPDARVWLASDDPSQSVGVASELRTPNQGAALVDPPFVIVHYTAGPSLEGAVRGFCDPVRKASAHLVIGRDGALAQVVSLGRQAWHAGASRWVDGKDTYVGLNKFSIGIELVNAGPLRISPSGRSFTTWYGATVPESDALAFAPEDLADDWRAASEYWMVFTEPQLSALVQVLDALRAGVPSLRGVLAHRDVAPGRKLDPGPAFPMSQIRALFAGRAES